MQCNIQRDDTDGAVVLLVPTIDTSDPNITFRDVMFAAARDCPALANPRMTVRAHIVAVQV